MSIAATCKNNFGNGRVVLFLNFSVMLFLPLTSFYSDVDDDQYKLCVFVYNFIEFYFLRIEHYKKKFINLLHLSK